MGGAPDQDVSCTGDVSIANEGELRAFADRGCSVLEGSLSVSSDTLLNLDALAPSTLRVITSDLVFDGNPALVGIEGLSGLVRVGGSLLVQQNAGLADLAGLESLEQLGSDAGVNALVIADNQALVELGALGGVSQMRVSIVITENTSLAGLTGIDALRATSSIVLANNASLAVIAGLTALQDCETLTVVGNATLISFELPALEGAGVIGITGNQALASLSLPSLANVSDTLTVSNNPALTSLGSLEALQTVGSLAITGNSMLPQCSVDALDQRLQACSGNCTGNDPNGTCD
jgi:hypothetical protein